MQRHTEIEAVAGDGLGSYGAADSRSFSQRETADPSPGVDENSERCDRGIPLDSRPNLDLREFVVEASLRRFVMDDRPRSRRAAAAVMSRFAARHGLQIFRLGRTRLYRAADFFQALATESESRLDRLLRRAAE